MSSIIPDVIRAAVRTLLGGAPVAWTPITGRGYANHRRWIVSLGDTRTAFVKAAADAQTAGWLRDEHRVYSQLQAGFAPRLLGWRDDGTTPVLVLEDLQHAIWPPPWSAGYVDAVLSLLREVAATPPPRGLRRLEDRRADLSSWPVVAADPEPFLRLGLCSARWLMSALPTLIAAADEAVLDGEALVHLDVRSDNLCIQNGRARLFDWNWAVVGNPLVDVAAWLPSLHAEGGPAPEEILPRGAAELAALLSGYFAARAGTPPAPTAPRVREVQLAQLKVALPWAARALGLPPPREA